jgi:ribulose kinase
MVTSKGRGNKKPVWLNDKLMATVKKKHSAYKRYMETRDGQDYLVYTRARNQAKSACKKAVKEYEKEIAKNCKRNPKAFYAYAKSKLKVQDSIADLIKPDGSYAATDTDKANVLNSFFL